MARVELRQVTKIYADHVTAVKSVHIDIHDQEFVVLVGPSGCGKSTLLRMIAGLEDITSGELFIDGIRVNDLPPKVRDIAMVFQNYALYPHMSVYQNMAFGLRLRHYRQAEIDERVKEAAEILGITHLLDRKPKALSGGQRQRVAVGRAIVRKPKVFLFDEPLSNLDAKLRVQMRAEISKLHDRLKTTMVYVTHDQVEAMTMGDRIVVLLDGEIQQFDTPLSLYNKPANKFVAGFIGSPAMNFLPGRIEQNHGLTFKTDSVSLPITENHLNRLKNYVNQNIILGIRPEHLSIMPSSKQSTSSLLNATIDVVEPMGNEVFLYVSAGKNVLTARIPPRNEFKTGTVCEVRIDMNKAHFFDPKSEQMICEPVQEHILS